jgi:hypothetical protein
MVLFFFKTLFYNGKLSRNRMASEFLHFGYFPARNKVRSKSVSQSEKSSLYIVYAASLPRFGRRGLRSRLPKKGVAAPAAPTIGVFWRNCYWYWVSKMILVEHYYRLRLTILVNNTNFDKDIQEHLRLGEKNRISSRSHLFAKMYTRFISQTNSFACKHIFLLKYAFCTLRSSKHDVVIHTLMTFTKLGKW